MTTGKTGGYNVKLFVSTVDESFKCSICHGVLKDAVELRCECHNIFCKSCIIEELDKNGSCQKCSEPIDKTPNGDWSYDLPRRYFRNILSALRLKCDMKGCEFIATIDGYEVHQSACKFNRDRRVKCQRCKAVMRAFEFEIHDCVQYLLVKITNLEATIEEQLQSSSQVTQAIQNDCLVSLHCERRSDKTKRTITVKEFDSIQTVCDKFSNELGCGDQFTRIYCCELDSAVDIKKAVICCGIKDGYSLLFYRTKPTANSSTLQHKPIQRKSFRE